MGSYGVSIVIVLDSEIASCGISLADEQRRPDMLGDSERREMFPPPRRLGVSRCPSDGVAVSLGSIDVAYRTNFSTLGRT